MKWLLDTHVLLWAAGNPQRLSTQAHALLNAPENELWFSAASLWEIAIKSGLGRADFQVDARLLRRGLLDNGYSELPIRSEHAVSYTHLDVYKRQVKRAYPVPGSPLSPPVAARGS